MKFEFNVNLSHESMPVDAPRRARRWPVWVVTVCAVFREVWHWFS